jgi:hypothetical protein
VCRSECLTTSSPSPAFLLALPADAHAQLRERQRRGELNRVAIVELLKRFSPFST